MQLTDFRNDKRTQLQPTQSSLVYRPCICLYKPGARKGSSTSGCVASAITHLICNTIYMPMQRLQKGKIIMVFDVYYETFFVVEIRRRMLRYHTLL